MRKIFSGLICAFAVIFLASFVSAQLTFSSQPNTLYNLGDVVDLTINVIPSTNLGGDLFVYLMCNGNEEEVNHQWVGSQKELTITIPLTINYTDFIDRVPNLCKAEAMFENDAPVLTNDFKVSNFANISITWKNKNFNPRDAVFIMGNAVKENGQNVNGLAEISITSQANSIYSASGAVNNGYFYFNFTLPSNIPSGSKLVDLKVYELDSSVHQTNKGHTSFTLLVNQVPTTLNLVPKDSVIDIIPGRTYSVKAILYDQGGDKINSPVNFNITQSNGESMGEKQVNTDEFINIPISYNDAPDTWRVLATASGLSSNLNFNILRNEKVSVELINRTLLVTNKGNVPYNNPIQINLGGKSLTFNVSLGVDESKKYVLTAPEGDYSVEVLSGGSSLFTGDLFLTGNAINIQEASQGVISFVQYRWMWGIVLLVLVFAIFFFFRKWHKKRFFKRINMNKKFRLRDGIVVSGGEPDFYSKDRIINSRNIADLSLSMQGEKQNASIICLNIKNFGDVRLGKGGVNETMNRLRDVVDESKAAIYENGSYLFFIFAPAKTKEFNNELAAIETAEKIRRILDDHNRLLKQKIEFGMSVHFGTMIAKQGINGLKFMSLGNFISNAKKLASLSTGEVFLSNEIRNRTATDIKTEKHSSGDVEYHTLLEIRNREKNQRFIKEFMSKMEKEEKDTNRKFFEH